MRGDNSPRLKPEFVDLMSEGFALDEEAWHILRLVVAEWETDPQSVACFDLRIVRRASEIVARKTVISNKLGVLG